MTLRQEWSYPSMWVLWFSPALLAMIAKIIYPSELVFWLVWSIGIVTATIISTRWRMKLKRDGYDSR